MTAKYKINEIEEMLSYSRHIHVNSQDGSDICKQCGHDLRHRIHIRLTPDKPVIDTFISIAEKAVKEVNSKCLSPYSEEICKEILLRIKTLTENE